MNLLKIQDMLKGAPDQTLVGYVQNPSGQVPTYLALSELQRRKEMRASYQANKPEDKSVAEDLVEESQPGVMGLPAGQPMQQAMAPQPEMPMEQMAQGGLAELDTGNMYDENNYANGGIVAFADRGYVDADRYINPSLTDLPEVPEDQLSYFDRVKRRYAKMKAKEAQDIKTQSEKEISGIKNIFGIKGGFEYGPKDSAYIPQVQAADPNNPANPAADNRVKMSDLPATTKTGTGFNMPTLNIPEALTIDKAMEDRKRAMELAGVPTDFYSSEAERNKADREALKDEKEKAKYFALAKAGFKMASQRPQYGKAQSTFADIAEGAEAGLEQYGKDVKDIKAEDRLLKQADRKLAEAQYLQQRGDAEGAMKKISEREALIQDYDKLKYSGAVQLKAASMSAGKQSDYEAYISRAEKDPSFYTKVDGKPVFDFQKAHNSYWSSRSTSGGLDQDTLWKSFSSGIDTLPNETFEMYKARKLGSGAGTAKTPTKSIGTFDR
jgi:hypothetical protein